MKLSFSRLSDFYKRMVKRHAADIIPIKTADARRTNDTEHTHLFGTAEEYKIKWLYPGDEGWEDARYEVAYYYGSSFKTPLVQKTDQP